MHKQKTTLTLDFSVSTQNLLVFKIGSVINTKINHSFSQFKGVGEWGSYNWKPRGVLLPD